MSKKPNIVQALRSAGIINEHDLLAIGEPCINYRTHEPRSPFSSGWLLWFKGRNLPGPWYEHGGKTFTKFGSDSDPLDEAKRFAAQVLGAPIEWAKSPMHSRGRYPTWITKRAAERALALVGGAK